MYPLETGTQAQTREESIGEGYDAIPLQTEENVYNVIQSSSLSTHPLVTRSKVVISNLKSLIDYTEHEPTNAKEALKHPHWRKAMEEEFQGLKKNNTWTLTQKQNDQKTVGCKWVFKIKRNSD